MFQAHKILTSILIAFTAFSSQYASAQLFIGPKAGVQLNKVLFQDKENNDLYNSDLNIGFNAGIGALLNVKDNFNIYSEIAYVQKGKKITSDFDPMLIHTARYNFIEMPLLFRLTFDAKIKKSKSYTWYVNIGPNVGYWLNGKGRLVNTEILAEEGLNDFRYKVTYNKQVAVFDQTDDRDNSTIDIIGANRIQLGLIFGGGLLFKPSKSEIISVDARVEISGTNIGKIDHEVEFPIGIFTYNDDLKSAIAGIRVSVAYLFEMNIKEGKKGKSTVDKKGKKK